MSAKHTPYLMLSVRDDGDDNVRELYSLVDGESIVASIKVPNLKNKKCFESLGWLMVTEADGSMSLLEPFSGTEIPLPHQRTFQDYPLSSTIDAFGFFDKMVLTASPSETSDFVLMAIGGGCRFLSFWRLGDEAWNPITLREGAYQDVVYHGNGNFYAIGHPGYVWLFNYSGNDNHMEGRIVVKFLAKILVHVPYPCCKGHFINKLVSGKRLYIVKTVDGSLLVITRTYNWGRDEEEGKREDEEVQHVPDSAYMTFKFQVYEIDTETGTFMEIYSLGTMAVFLGHNNTIAVDPSRLPGPGIKANHIYFTDDNWENYYGKPNSGGIDSGIYDMETGTIEPIYPGEVLCSEISPSTWITPCSSAAVAALLSSKASLIHLSRM